MSTVEPSAGTAEAPAFRPGRGRWWRRLLRLVLGTAIVVTLAVGVLRVTSLWGIPDAPEPFDVAAFTAATVPDERNAIVAFAEAERMLGGERELMLFGMMARRPRQSADATPEALAWIAAHRPALETWRRGTDRPEARPIGTAVPIWSDVLPDVYLQSWLRMAGVEADRLREAGDVEGAWGWHKARLRATLLVARGRGIMSRHRLAEVFNEVCRGAADWAEGPKVTVPLLRRAIADVEAMAPLHGTEAESLKVDYLAIVSEFDDFADPARGRGNHIDRALGLGPASRTSPAAGLTSRVVPPEILRPAYAGLASFVEAEPERSRRIARMVFANWLAQADRRPADRAATVSTYPLVFDEDAGPTPALSPATLARRAATAPYFAIARSGFAPPPPWWHVVDQWPKTYTLDRQARADLILSLADRIYAIEQGKPPANVEALVGTVLPKLPDDYGLATEPAPPNPDREAP